MNPELEDRLAEEFEFMRVKLSPDGVTSGYSSLEIEAEDGWYRLLYNMCKEIAKAIEPSGKTVRLVTDQIKEKYGTLRFYYHLEGVDAGKNELNQKISDIVEKYEAMSEQICEICGCKGMLRTDLTWVQTLCDACYSKCIETDQKK